MPCQTKILIFPHYAELKQVPQIMLKGSSNCIIS